MRHIQNTGGVAQACRRDGSAGRRVPIGTHSYYSTPSPGVKPERSHWRDEALSLRHRSYGFDCPAVDLDFILLEFNTGRPCALVEYKSGDPRPLDFGHPSYRALVALADASEIPALVAFYSPVFWSFTCYPLNSHAREWLTDGERLCELEYVAMLYQIRGREVPASVACRLNRIEPKEVGL